MQKMSAQKMPLMNNHPSSLVTSGGFRRSARLLALSALLACTGLTGCVVMSDNHTTTSGHKIDASVFAQVEPGKSKEFVVNLLGEPSEKYNNDDGTERWTWRYSETHRSASGFIVLFASSSDTTTKQARNVQFKGGVVTRAWTD